MKYTEQENIRRVLKVMYSRAALPPLSIIINKTPELLEDGVIVAGPEHKKYKLRNRGLTTVLDSFESVGHTPSRIVYKLDPSKNPAFVRINLWTARDMSGTMFMCEDDIVKYSTLITVAMSTL